jgi:hypothetical protein
VSLISSPSHLARVVLGEDRGEVMTTALVRTLEYAGSLDSVECAR